MGRSTDRHVRWLHHLAHRRVAFTEAWLADKAGVDVGLVAVAASKAFADGWIKQGAFGGVAGTAPEGRGRTWIGRLPTR
jgi:hypothetical protein